MVLRTDLNPASLPDGGRYLVVGGGALGALLVAQWTLVGLPAVLVARGRAHAVIARDGVRIRRPHGDEVVPVAVTDSLAAAAPTAADAVVLAVKSQDAETTIADLAWRPLADGAGVVADLDLITLQNGLATEDFALRRFARVYGASVGIAASHLEPGVIVSPSYPAIGVIALGRYPASDPVGEARHAAALREAAYVVTIEPDVAAAKRRKLLGNLRNTVEVFAAEAAVIDAAHHALAAEARGVFEAAGLPVAPSAERSEGEPRLEFGSVSGHTPHLSTWQSFARGSSSEGDYLVGEIALLARRHGVEAPLAVAVQRALGALAARGGKPDEVTLDSVLPAEALRSAATAEA